MIPKEILRNIAQSAHRTAAEMTRLYYTYKEGLIKGFRSAWAEHYTRTKEVVAETIEEAYRTCKAFNTGCAKSVTIRRDLRKKGLNCEVLVADDSNKKLLIRFTAVGALKELVKMCGKYSFPLDEFIRAITITAPTIERRIIIDELLAALA